MRQQVTIRARSKLELRQHQNPEEHITFRVLNAAVHFSAPIVRSVPPLLPTHPPRPPPFPPPPPASSSRLHRRLRVSLSRIPRAPDLSAKGGHGADAGDQFSNE
eukprot:6206689-Pleurochrysis_carterae.AAC.2